MIKMTKRAVNFIPKLYFAITPLFILLDYTCGINIRVAVLDDKPLYKGLYYAFCLLCGVTVYLVPRYSSIITFVESTIIIFMTVLGFLIPYIQILEQMDDILNADLQYVSPPHIINLSIAGVIASFTLRKSLREIGIDGH